MPIPSLVDYHFNKLNKVTLEPYGLSVNGSYTFKLKEDGLITINVSFTPCANCCCLDFQKSKQGKLPMPICYHILYILIRYFKISELSLMMFHKWNASYYESLLSYYDHWILLKYEYKQLRRRRKKKPYNFNEETKGIIMDKSNIDILNPMLHAYIDEECAICLESLSTKNLALCSECQNYSHSKCLNRWRQKKMGCHLCRDNPSKYKDEKEEEFPQLLATYKFTNY